MPRFLLPGYPMSVVLCTRSKLGEDGKPVISRMMISHSQRAEDVQALGVLCEYFEAPVRHACNSYDLMTNFAPFTCVYKKDIPANTRYVMQGQFQFGSDGRARMRFFCFETVPEVIAFFLSFADLQKSAVSASMLMMECTRKGVPKKWVLDLDGEPEKLYNAGFADAKDHCTLAELHVFETAAISYATLLLRALFDGGRFRCNQVVFTVAKRHQFAENGGCVKASLHITLDAMAKHETWRAALCAAHARMKAPGYAEKCVSGDARQTLAVEAMDDKAVLRNSAGQNMGTLYSSKAQPVATAKRPPMFELVGSFIIDLQTMCIDALDGIDCMRCDTGRFYFTSMLVRGPCTVELVAMNGDESSFYSSMQRGANSQPPPGLVSQRVGIEDLPDFAQRLLFDSQDFRGVNTTMESLYAHLPFCIPMEHRVRGTVKCIKVDRPSCCVRYLACSVPSFKQHKSNGCKVCVYRPPSFSAPRVFVMCFGCKCDGWKNVPHPGAEQSPAMWPWLEIFACDLDTIHRLKSKRQKT